MPRRNAVPRVGIRLPKPMMDEVDRLVKEHPELFCNRQQFVESALRERIEKSKGLA